MKSISRQLQLLRYVAPHWRGLVVMLAAMALSIGLDVLRPWPMKLLVDQVLGGGQIPESLRRFLAVLPGSAGPKGLLLWVCISTVLVFLLGTLMSIASGVASVG